ncbi:hypothetical protein D3C87_1472190 [compost metagenome]
MVFAKAYAAGVGSSAKGLSRGRPDGTGWNILEVHIGAPIIARGIFAPACQSDIPPAAIARSGTCDHHRIAAVREHMRCHGRVGWRAVNAANRGQNAGERARSNCKFLGTGLGHRNLSWQLLCEQQLAGHDHRLAMKAGPHASIKQGVDHGDDGHPLVMGHDISHQREFVLGRHARRREIEGFVETIRT